MKYLINILFILLISLSAYNQSLTDSLQAYYPLDGNANDSTGNGNNAVINGATITSDRFGRNGKAYYFDGDEDWINLPESIINNIGSDWATSIWFEVEDYSSTGYVIGSSPDYRFYLTVSSGNLNVRFHDGSNTNVSTITTGVWYNVVMSSENDSVTVWLNNDSLTTIAITTVGTLQNLNYGSFSQSGNYFIGKIDEGRWYNRSLTTVDVDSIYNLIPDFTYCDTVTFSVTGNVTNTYSSDGVIDQTVISPQTVTHSWSNGQSTEDLTGLSPGNYTDTITMSDSGCIITESYTISLLDPCDTTDIIITADIVNAGDTIGSIDVTISGEGQSPYSYIWNTGETTEDLTSASKGSHTIVVTDANGCVDSSSFTVIGDGTATYLSNFEDQNDDPEIGTKSRELSSNAEGPTAAMYVTANPDADTNNNSAYVLKHVLLNDGLQRRAEYTCSRLETLDKKYIYTWSIYQPVNSYADVNLTYMSFNQFKTWPCEAGPVSSSGYEQFDTLICTGGGIFNDMFYYPDIEQVEYRVRAEPNCNFERIPMDMGRWHRFVLEVYWTDTYNGYYNIWHNDTLYGYSDSIRTLPYGFVEGSCDMYWSNGMYSSWFQEGDSITDSIVSYTDNIAIYDIDSGYVVSDVCENCEMPVPDVPTDSLIFRVNINGGTDTSGYNNGILSWSGEISSLDLSSVDYGQSTGIDIYMPTSNTSTNNSLSDFSCFPSSVLTTSIQWNDTVTNQVLLKDLNPNNTYTFKLLSARSGGGGNVGTQIWVGGSTRDTVVAQDNVCNVAKLTGLTSDINGELEINVKSIDDVTPEVRINAIEIIEYPSAACGMSVLATKQNEIFSKQNGAIDISVLGGTEPYSYLWSDDSMLSDRAGLSSGDYTVTVTDSRGCETSATYTIINRTKTEKIDAKTTNAIKIKIGQ